MTVNILVGDIRAQLARLAMHRVADARPEADIVMGGA